MGMLARVGQVLGGLRSRLLARAADPFEVGWRNGGGSFGTFVRRNVELWLRNYGEHSRLQSVVRRVARDVAAVKWQVYQEQDGEMGPEGRSRRRALRKHPLKTLWDKPHPWFSGTKFRYLLQVHLELAGEAFILVKRTPGTLVPKELWPIPPHWVTRIPGPGRPYWEINLNGKVEQVPIGEIIWLQDPDPLNPYGRGLSVASAIDDEVAQNEWANKWNNQFFRNAARPDFVIGVPGVEPKDYDRLRAQWEEKHQGFWNAFRPAFLSADAKVHLLTRGQKDMDFVSMLRYLRDAIFQNWQVPPEIMGVVENSNRATAEAAMFLYALNVLVPRLQFIAEEMAYWLVPLYGEEDLALDYESPVQETKEFRLNQTSEGLKNGALKRNEWRVANGWDPDPDHGDVYLVPRNTFEEGPQAQNPPDDEPQQPKKKPASEPEPEEDSDAEPDA